MPKNRECRIYLKGSGHYCDFRPIGGKREALIAPGEKRATADRDVAEKVKADRLKDLLEAAAQTSKEAKGRALGVIPRRSVALAPYASRHLVLKAEDGEGVPSWLAQAEHHLEVAVRFFGGGIDLASLTARDMTRYVEHLRRLDNGRGGQLGETSVRKHLNSLSNLFRRALSEGHVPSNPVANMYSKPTEDAGEAEFLDPAEAALLLEAARTYQAPFEPVRQEHGGAISAKANPHLYPILATFLLTGGRKSEVLGLEVDDVSFRLGKIYFRSNEWRRLKTRGSKRSVPLWPQLREILETYMKEREQSGGIGTLLFPSVGGRPRGKDEEAPTGEGMIQDVRKALDAIGDRAGFPKGHVRLHMLRHTYTAARIQTLDRGAPVALYTVARELGHSSTDMIEDRYGHLHDRAVLGGSEVVEFRVDNFRDQLAAKLQVMEFGRERVQQ